MSQPQILTSLSGEPVNSREVWEKHRRNEIFLLFQNFVYGIPPLDRPEDLSFSVRTTEREHDILQKTVTLKWSAWEFDAEVFVPKTREAPLPAFLVLMHEFAVEHNDIVHDLDTEYLPIRTLIDRGYAAVALKTKGICQDLFQNKNNSDKRYCDGIFTALSAPRRTNAWSIIASWAWGASRVMDYLETDEDIDETRVIVAGHSRTGKTALWTAASDPRFCMAISNNSGCTGAAYTRGKVGEHIKDINVTRWFCENYSLYEEDEEMLPVDQHMLLALQAPRPLYVASSSEDEWADPDAELRSCRLAGEAYGLYGLPGLIAPETVEDDTSYHDGMIGYHRKTGKHSLTKRDWAHFLAFTDRHIKK